MVSSKTIEDLETSNEKDNLKKIEAILFVSGRFLTMSDLVSLSNLDPLRIKDLIQKLREKYNKEESAIEIVERNEMWKMDVSQEYSYVINKIATGSTEFSKAEQETLALIAYKQSIKQSVLIKIRGNKAYDHVKKFSDLNLIKKKKEGHTNILSLSDEFYDYFGVSDKEGEDVLRSIQKEEIN